MLDITADGAEYRGGDGVSVFPVPFPFLEASHVRARIREGDGTARDLAAGVDFIVNNVSESNGELILLGDALAEDCVLTLRRRVPLTQDIHFHNQGPNSPAAMESAADKLTMIAQQLQSQIDGRIPYPEGSDTGETNEWVVKGASVVAEIRADVVGLKKEIADRAPLRHGHGVGDVDGLAESLAGKAGAVHDHPMEQVVGLVEAMRQKADADDPRLERMRPHAKTHAGDGEDPIRPEDLGVLPLPPADGNPYLAAAGGWIRYIAPSADGGDGGGTADHSQLLNRDAADQHPQSAVRNLVRDLDGIRGDIAGLAGADERFASELAEKAFVSQLPAVATTTGDGLLSAADKRKLDALPASGGGLPENGGAGDVLVKLSDGAAWTTPDAFVGALPLMSAGQKGVARLAASSGLEIDAGGALRIASDTLVSMAGIDARFDGLDGRMTVAEDGIDSLGKRLDSLGSLAGADDAPANGKPHVRQDGNWRELPVASEGFFVGEIRLFPFRKDELPEGWYFCNGDRYPLASAQGDRLNSLSAAMKSDWGISVVDGGVNLPDLFGANGGCFLRPVDNASRLPGSRQEDAIRNITGSYSLSNIGGVIWANTSSGTSECDGAFGSSDPSKAYSFGIASHGYNSIGDLQFDASRCVPTADENRPANIGMTPAIYLGV